MNNGLVPLEVRGVQYQCLCKNDRCVVTKTDHNGRVLSSYDVLPSVRRCSCKAWFWSEGGMCKHLQAVLNMIRSLNEENQ